MKIQWNKVTWYSKLIALILFIGVFGLAFHLGRAYQEAYDGTDVWYARHNAIMKSGRTLPFGRTYPPHATTTAPVVSQ